MSRGNDALLFFSSSTKSLLSRCVKTNKCLKRVRRSFDELIEIVFAGLNEKSARRIVCPSSLCWDSERHSLRRDGEDDALAVQLPKRSNEQMRRNYQFPFSICSARESFRTDRDQDEETNGVGLMFIR